MDQEAHMQCSILSVDDDKDLRDLLHELITRMGHTSVTAADGVEALDQLSENSFDIVITDINMPRMDGLELIRRIHKGFKDLDVIAFTGYHNKYKYTDVIEAGASDFISKPFNVNELEAKINRIIRERSLREQLKRLSVRDGLTGLYNRRHFDETLRSEAVRASRQNYDLYLLIIDIDSFKEYNDQHGHQRGDDALTELARIVSLHIRKNVDSGYRYGGDEFAVIIPHANRQQALLVAERLRSRYSDCHLVPTTISVGMARLRGPLDAIEENVQRLLRSADISLYRAKHNGGNQVCITDETANDIALPLATAPPSHH
ncbi:MAG TPA: diguanylate cyclase [Syntrophobacteria bacterium]|nr:diguanylate cyclase [Syntrophobacteria bacterium]